MEIEKESVPWLNESHPNYERWKHSREIAEVRGSLVYSLLSTDLKCKQLTVLDLGSGEGGTTLFFSRENNVISFDFSLFRLRRQNNVTRVNGRLLPSLSKKKFLT